MILESGLHPSEWRGAFSSEASPRIQIVRDDKAWESLWKESIGQAAPRVDFSKYFAAAVFLGLRQTGGYSVAFLDPLVDKNRATLRYKEKAPGQGTFVIQTFTQPYAIKLYAKTALEIVVSEER